MRALFEHRAELGLAAAAACAGGIVDRMTTTTAPKATGTKKTGG